jgi:hypothetical protein
MTKQKKAQLGQGISFTAKKYYKQTTVIAQ